MAHLLHLSPSRLKKNEGVSRADKTGFHRVPSEFATLAGAMSAGEQDLSLSARQQLARVGVNRL